VNEHEIIAGQAKKFIFVLTPVIGEPLG